MVSVVSLLCFDRCEVVAVFVGPAVVEPVDPFGGGDFEVVEAFPGQARFDQLGLVEPDHRLRERVDAPKVVKRPWGVDVTR